MSIKLSYYHKSDSQYHILQDDASYLIARTTYLALMLVYKHILYLFLVFQTRVSISAYLNSCLYVGNIYSSKRDII